MTRASCRFVDLNAARARRTPTDAIDANGDARAAAHKGHSLVLARERARDSVPETADAHRRAERGGEDDHHRVPEDGLHGRTPAVGEVRTGVHSRSEGRGRHGGEGADQVAV